MEVGLQLKKIFFDFKEKLKFFEVFQNLEFSCLLKWLVESAEVFVTYWAGLKLTSHREFFGLVNF